LSIFKGNQLFVIKGIDLKSYPFKCTHRPFVSLIRVTPVKWSANLTGQAEDAEVIYFIVFR